MRAKNLSYIGACCAVLLATTGLASAVALDPTYTSFGTLPGATFGGSGIPNTAVAITEVQSGAYNITMGLTAHARYSNPTVNNDGAGNFWAVSGGDGANGQPGYARWNVGYYLNFTPDINNSIFSNPSGFSARLFFDKNPAAGNDVSTFVPLEPSILNGSTFDSQNSWNLGMVLPFGLIDPTAFNPSADGEYDVALAVYKNNVEIGRSAISVNVNSTGTQPVSNVPDGGASVIFLGMGLLGLVGTKKVLKK